MAKALTPQEIRSVFETFDKDKNNQICAVELENVFQACGVFADDKEIAEIIKTVGGADNYIQFDEFLTIIGNVQATPLLKLKDLVEDIAALQNAFLPNSEKNIGGTRYPNVIYHDEPNKCATFDAKSKSKVDHSDDMSEIVKILRDSVANLNPEQVDALIKFHYNQFESAKEVQAKRSKQTPTLLVRKVLPEDGIPSYFSEQYGNPALGGFFAEARATQGLTAEQIIYQLGLDYNNSTFIDAKGNPKKVIYTIEAEMDVSICLVPLDPRVRSKVLEAVTTSPDPEIKHEAQVLYDRSHDCAVDDGSPTSVAAKIKLPPPYTGTGFCVHGKKYSDSIEVRFVQEIVGIDSNLSKKFIPFPVGTTLYAVGAEAQQLAIASWNGLDWKLHVTPSTLPLWVVASSNFTAEQLVTQWTDALAKGAAKNPPGSSGVQLTPVSFSAGSVVRLQHAATNSTLKLLASGSISPVGDGTDEWTVVDRGNNIFSLQSKATPSRYVRVDSLGLGNSGGGDRWSYLEAYSSNDGNWFGLFSVANNLDGSVPYFLAFNSEGEVEPKATNAFSESKFAFA